VKKIIALIPALVLLMLFAVAPAMAATATKVPVHGGGIAGGTPHPFDKMWLTDGTITQLRGGGSQGGQLELYIYPSIEEPDYVLTVNEEYDAMVNWHTGEGVWRFTEIWEYVVDGQTAGTFKGEYIVKTTGAFITPLGPVTWTDLEGHAVLQGDGEFYGQTLMLDFERTRPDLGTFEGFLLTR
jgi:hypothetical protein